MVEFIGKPYTERVNKNKIKRYQDCKCLDCGNIFKAEYSYSRSGRLKNCGCSHKGKTHSDSGTKIYKLWLSIKNRGCCGEWQDYLNFKTWAYKNGFSELFKFDIIKDNDLEVYSPINSRFTSRSEVKFSQPKFKGVYLSKYKGVTFHKKLNKYVAQCKVGKKLKYLGCFEDEEDARQSYDLFVLNNIDFKKVRPNFNREYYEKLGLI